MSDDISWIEIGIAFIVVIILGLLGYQGLVEYRAKQACLRRGYPEAHRAFFAPAYCIKRVNQTDVVVRLDSLP